MGFAGKAAETEDQAREQMGERQVRLRVDEQSMASGHANAFGTNGTAEEVMLDFGLNVVNPASQNEAEAVVHLEAGASGRIRRLLKPGALGADKSYARPVQVGCSSSRPGREWAAKMSRSARPALFEPARKKLSVRLENRPCGRLLLNETDLLSLRLSC